MTARLASPQNVGPRGTMNAERAGKIAAKRLGITAEEYMTRRANGEKWCWACKGWHRLGAFNADKSKRDGCSNICRQAWQLRYSYAQPISLNAADPAMNGMELRWDTPRRVQIELVDPGSDQNAIEIERAEELRAILGDMDVDDVQRLRSWDLERLRDRLVEAGFAPRGIQWSERKRLAAPARHSNVSESPLVPGRKTRLQKIAHKAANRASGNSNRPSQKPRKRWERSN